MGIEKTLDPDMKMLQFLLRMLPDFLQGRAFVDAGYLGEKWALKDLCPAIPFLIVRITGRIKGIYNLAIPFPWNIDIINDIAIFS